MYLAKRLATMIVAGLTLVVLTPSAAWAPGTCPGCGINWGDVARVVREPVNDTPETNWGQVTSVVAQTTQ